jgi:hypothetical protein
MADYRDFALNSGEYIPQYVGSPLDTINQTNQQLQERHYKNIADLSNTQIALANMASKLGEGQRSYLENQAKEIEETLSQFASTGAENATAKVSMLSRRLLGDEKLNRMMNAAQKRAEQEKLADEISAKTGKRVLMGKDYTDWNTATPDHEMFMRGYNAKPAAELDVTEDMKRVIDQVTPDKFEKIGLTGARFDKFKQDFKSDPRAAIAGYVKSLNVVERSEKLDKLQQELLNVFKGTPSYKQQIEYNASTPQDLEQRFKDFTEINKYTQENVDYVKDIRPEFELNMRALQAVEQPPVNPYSGGNWNEATNIPIEEYQKVEGQLNDMKMLAKNVQSPDYVDPRTNRKLTDEERQELLTSLNNRITQLDDQLGSTRKAIEKDYDWQKMFTDFINSKEVKNSYKSNKNIYEELPKTVDEFKSIIRAGKIDNEFKGAAILGAKGLDGYNKLQRIARQYKNGIEEHRENIKLATKFNSYSNPLSPTGQPLNVGLNEVETNLKQKYLQGTEMFDPISGDQITVDYITKQIGEVKINGEIYKHDPSKDVVKMTDGMVDGKVILEVQPTLVGSNGIERPANKKFQITLGNQETARKLMKQAGETLNNPGDRAGRLQMIGYAEFGPSLARSNMYYAQNEVLGAKIRFTDGIKDVKIIPIEKNTETGRNSKFKLKIGDNYDLDINGNPIPYSSEADIARRLGEIVEPEN